jgi:hypothetical protein
MPLMKADAPPPAVNEANLAPPRQSMSAANNPAPWRSRLAREVGWYFLIKLCLLTLLWALFFSSSHRCRVDGIATAHRLALTVFGTASGAGSDSSGEDSCD